jgi:hypothetical protein
MSISMLLAFYGVQAVTLDESPGFYFYFFFLFQVVPNMTRFG